MSPAGADPRLRATVLVVVTVVLAAAAVALLVAGVGVRETTGGLLLTPIRQVHLVGGALLGGTVAGVATVLTAMSAVPAVRRARGDGEARTTPGGSVAGPAGDPDSPDTSGDTSDTPGDPPTASVLPGPDRRS